MKHRDSFVGWIIKATIVVISGLFGVTTIRTMRAGNLNGQLIRAVKTKNSARVRTLLGLGADPNVTISSTDPEPSLWEVYWRVLAHLRTYNYHGPTILSLSAGNEDYDTVKYLLDAGADANCTDEWGTTPLIEAGGVACILNAGGCTDDCVRAAKNMPVYSVLKELIDHGGRPNQVDRLGQTALSSVATCVRQPSCVRLLVSRGANVNSCYETGDSALACAIMAGDYRMVKTLLQLGAQQSVVGGQCVAPTQLALELGDRAIARLLVAHGFVLDQTDLIAAPSKPKCRGLGQSWQVSSNALLTIVTHN